MDRFGRGGDHAVQEEAKHSEHRGSRGEPRKRQLGRPEEENPEGRALIFLDSLIIALADTDDQFHTNAIQVANKLQSQKVISDLVVSESVTGVGARLGPRDGREVFDNLVHDPTVRTVYLN